MVANFEEKNFTRTLQELYKNFTRTLQELFKTCLRSK